VTGADRPASFTRKGGRPRARRGAKSVGARGRRPRWSGGTTGCRPRA